jgi:hypothetical protein
MDMNEALRKISKGKKKTRKGLPKRVGRRAAKYTRYYAVTYNRRKLTHILKRNGLAAARAWADARSILSLLTSITK